MDRSRAGTVVVGIDGTQDGLRAIRYAAGLACDRDLALRLVHVVNEIGVYGAFMPYVPDESFNEIGEAIVGEARALALNLEVPPDRLSAVICHGPRAPRLIDSLQDARCVVLGTRASVWEHLFTGSTTIGVIARADVPVVCVPEAGESGAPRAGVVVVGADGSDATEPVLEVAFGEAADRRADLRVVHAWRPGNPYDAAVQARAARVEWERSVTDALTKTATGVASRFPDVSWTVTVEFERVADGLHRAATGADLLVLGRRGHHSPFSLLVGSVTRTLLRTATVPVLVVPVPDDRHQQDPYP